MFDSRACYTCSNGVATVENQPFLQMSDGPNVGHDPARLDAQLNGLSGAYGERVASV